MNTNDQDNVHGNSELIVIFNWESDIYVESGRIVSRKGSDTGPVNDLLKKYKAKIKPIGSKSDKTVHPDTISQEPYRFFVITGPEKMGSLRGELLETGLVEAAYVKPPADDPGAPD